MDVSLLPRPVIDDRPPHPAVAPANRVRLLMVNSTLHIGGAEQVAASLAEHVNRNGFEVRACYLKQPGIIHDQMLRAGVDLKPIPGLVQGKRDYFTSNKLLRLIRELGVQVIHTHDIHGMIDGSICRLREPRLRLVHTFHYGNYPHRTRWHKFIEGTLWRVPDALIAVGHEQAKSIRKLYRIPENRLRVLWNGVDDPTRRPASAPPEGYVPADVPTIASVSTLIRQKGLEHLLDAAALMRDRGDKFRLLIAGHGALEAQLKARAARLGLTNIVTFLGWVPQANDRVLPRCDIFVQSSLWEAMSVVLLEAMAAGKPMVITTVGENPHVALDGQTALTIPPGDATALADNLGRLLRDPELRARMGAAARERYLEHFTTQHMVRTHEALYAELARG